MKSAGVGLVTRPGGIAGETGFAVFEHGLSKILRLNWWEVANLGRSSWKKGKYKFVHEAVRCWGGPRVPWKKAFLENLGPSVDVGFV